MTSNISQLFSHPTAAASLNDVPLDWDVYHPDAQILTLADGSKTSGHITTSVLALWNENSLFVLMGGFYQRLRVILPPPPDDVAKKTSKLWEQSDVFEVFLGAGARHAHRYFEFQVAPDGRWCQLAVTSGVASVADEARMSGFRCRAAIDPVDRVWRAVFDIPLKLLGTDLTAIEGNFYRASGAYHGDELLAWSPTGYGDRCFHRPDRFGRVVLLNQS